MNTFFDDLEPILDFALSLHDLGFSISPPVARKGKFPLLSWKPYQTQRASKRQLIDWAFEYPYFNYGVITGVLSGIICLDADNQTAEAILAKHCPQTPMRQESGSGRGQHYIYRHPGTPIPTGANLKVYGVEVKGLDMRGDGGLFIGPGSLHRLTGLPYHMVEPWTKEMLAVVPVFDMTWLGLDVEPPKPADEEPAPARGDISLSRKLEYAREFLQGKKGSTGGQGKAESYCFAVASALVHGFDLSPDEAEDLLLEWGRQESNKDAHGNYYPWEREEIRHKLEDAASQEDPQSRHRGYLLPAWDHKAVEAVFDKQKPVKPYKAPVVLTALETVLKGPDNRVVPLLPPATVPDPHTPESLQAANPEPPAPESLQAMPIPDDSPVGRFVDDPKTAYLWKGHHANDFNVKPQERLARAKSVLEAYCMVPEKGLLPDFLATYLPTTDCSCTLLLGAGLALGASLLNRRVWINQGNKRVHPHLWCGLVAASGERKSTAVNLVSSILKRDTEYQGVCLVSDSTWPALAPKLGVEVKPGANGEPDWLAARLHCEQQPESWLKGVGTLCIDELGGWLKTLNQSVNQGLRETLTGMYESPHDIPKATKTAGCYYIWRPCLTILAASTDTWLSENTTESDEKGGFLGRWLFFVSSGPDYKLPRCDPPDPDAEQRLLTGMERLKAISGEAKVEEQAWNEYAEWVKKMTLPERLSSFRSRLENAALKIALIYEATQGDLTVRPETMGLAMRVVDWLAGQLQTFAEEKLLYDPAQKRIGRVRQVLATHGTLTRSELIRLTRLSAEQLDEALTTLFQTEAIAVSDVPGKGRTGKVYRWVG